MKDLQIIVAPFQKEPKELLQFLCKYVNDRILEEISMEDYGHNTAAYLKELKQIKQNAEIHKMNFDVALSEVVELTRWKKPKQTKDNRITTIQETNLSIAFSCAILLNVPHEWYHNRMGENSAIIRLIQSSEYLEYIFPKIWQKVSQLLAWRITENNTDPEEIPFFIFGLVLTLLKSKDYEEIQIVKLIGQLLILEKKSYEKEGDYVTHGSSKWLFRITFYNQLQKDWESYHSFLTEQMDKVKSEELKTKLQELVDLLT